MRINLKKSIALTLFTFLSFSCSTMIQSTTKISKNNEKGIPEFYKYLKNGNNNPKKEKPYFGDVSLKINTSIIQKIDDSQNTNKELVFSIKSKDTPEIRKKRFLLGEHPIQSSHKQDSQIFDINSPNSLSQLSPYEGEADIQGQKIGGAIADGIPSFFNLGQISLMVKPPYQENLQKILTKYNGTLIESNQDNNSFTALIKIDLDKTDLSKLETNLYSLNSYSASPIQNAEFSSINTAKTISIFMDILVNSSDLVELAGLNNVLNDNGIRSSSPNGDEIVSDENTPSTYETTDNSSNYSLIKDGKRIIRNTPDKSTNSWWLSSFVSSDGKKSTDITKAQQYPIGQGVNIAVIDKNFGDIKKYKDFGSSIIDDSKVENSDKVDLGFGHGFRVVSIISSEIDDFFGISGIVPRAKVLPISRGDFSSTCLNRLKDIRDYNNNHTSGERISVVNISSSWYINKWAVQAPKNTTKCITPLSGGLPVCDPTAVEMQEIIQELSNPRNLNNGNPNPNHDSNKESVIIVSSGGNDGIEGVKENGLYPSTVYTDSAGKILNDPIYLFQFPVSLSYVIGVGAYELDNIDSGKFIRADFDKKTTGLSPYFPSDYRGLIIASNYGDNIDVWAPGDNIPIYIPNDASDTSRKWDRTKGTSFSSPIVASVAAQLKVFKPDLTVGEFSTVIHETGSTVTDPSFKTSANSDQRFLNALDAINYLVTNPVKAKPVLGKYENGNITNFTGQVFPINGYYSGFYTDLQGKDVVATGWIKNNKLTVLQMREYIPSLTYNTKSIPIVYSNVPTTLKSGDQFAIQITPSIKDQLNNVFLGGIQLTLLQIVQNYAIYNVPDLGKSTGIATTRLIDIVIKNNLGQTVETLADALKILLDAITQKNRFPASITVNGVTTQLDYGYIFSPQSSSDLLDYSTNNNIPSLIRRNPSDNYPEWVQENGMWGLNFINSPYGVLQVPNSSSYDLGSEFTIVSISKKLDPNSVGILCYKWTYAAKNDWGYFIYDNSYIFNNGFKSDYSTHPDFWGYNASPTNSDNTYAYSFSAKLAGNQQIAIVKNQTTVEAVPEYYGGLVPSINSVATNSTPLYIGNSPDLTVGNDWTYAYNDKGSIFGFAIIKQALSDEQIKELHKQMGF